MICEKREAIVVDVDTMDIIKSIDINTKLKDYGITYSENLTALLTAHICPETDSKFMLEFYDSKFITLRTIETGAR